jgi:hypothetical protein
VGIFFLGISVFSNSTRHSAARNPSFDVQLHIKESVTTIVSMIPGLRLTAHPGMKSTLCFAGIITAGA